MWTLGGGPLERTVANCTHIIVSLLKAWKSDCGRDRVRRCRIVMSFQEGLEGDRGGIECNNAAF